MEETEPISVTVDEQPVTADADQPTQSSEGEQWQETEPDASLLADIVIAEQAQADAEIAQANEEMIQSRLLAALGQTMETGLAQIRESLAIALEAQTAELVRLRNELASQSDHYSERATKPKANERPSAAERARKRRERYEEKKANRKQ